MWKRRVLDCGERAALLLDPIFSDCRFGRGQCCIGDKTAHTSAFDFGSLIDERAFVIGEVNECLFPKAWSGSPTRCRRLFFCHKQMVSPKFLLWSYSARAVRKNDDSLQGFRLRSRASRLNRWATSSHTIISIDLESPSDI